MIIDKIILLAALIFLLKLHAYHKKLNGRGGSNPIPPEAPTKHLHEV